MTDSATAEPVARKLSLSAREEQVARAFAFDGLSVVATAERCGLTAGTVKSYLKRIRQKYTARGVPAGSAILLRKALLGDGYVETPPTPE